MRVEAYAKVNLTLEVGPVREDGYHELKSVVAPISLCDTLEIETAADFRTDTGFPDDLIVKAARLLAPDRGAFVHVEKRIPVGGGLGGGSADAAAALIALNEFWGLGKSKTELMELGAKVGSDVPSLVYGAPCIMEGRGEIVRPLPTANFMGRDFPLWLVLANPGVASSTREIYAKSDSRLAFSSEKEYNTQLVNDLEAAAIACHPEIGRLKARMVAVCGDASKVLMSGSGSTVFAIVDGLEAAERMAGTLREDGYWAEVAHTIVR